MTEQEKESRKFLERLTMINDAVFAIALTLLVLELKLPETAECHTAADMWHCIKEMSPKLLAFLLSIIMVGGNWISVINIQRTQVKADTKYLILLIIYLSLISLTPFTCSLIGNYPDNPMSYIVFGCVLILLIINSLFYMSHCLKMNLYHPDADIKELEKLKNVIPFVGVFIALIAASAFYNTTLAFVLFLVYCLVPFFVTKSLRINHKE